MTQRNISNQVYNRILTRCLLVGPPVGLYTMLPFVWLSEGADHSMSRVPAMAIFGLIFCYPLGGLQAAIGGLILAEYANRFGKLPIFLPIAAAMLFAIISLAFMYFQPFSPLQIRGFWYTWTFVNLVPGLVCWYICKNLISLELVHKEDTSQERLKNSSRNWIRLRRE
jgi:hypothetical protein